MRFSATVRQSPRKMRLVMDLIRGKAVNEAYAILQFNKKLAARQIAKMLKSAVANAEQQAQRANEPFDVDTLRGRRRAGANGTAAEAVHGGGAGTRHADPEADQPRADRRGAEGGEVMGQKTHPVGFRLGVIEAGAVALVRGAARTCRRC